MGSPRACSCHVIWVCSHPYLTHTCTPQGGKMYIQDKVEEYADEVFDLLENGAHIFFCGLKGMMPGIQEMLERVATEKGLKFEDFLEKLKKARAPLPFRFPPCNTHGPPQPRPRMNATRKAHPDFVNHHDSTGGCCCINVIQVD